MLLRAAAALSAALVVLAALAAGFAVLRYRDRPDMAPWMARYGLAPSSCPEGRRCVTVRWLGVATVAIDDGETTLLSDGFFTRVPVLDLVLGRPVAPDEGAIEAGLARAGLERVAALFPVHSHYDHAMDVAPVARRTGAQVLGTASTAWIARGGGLPESRITEVEPSRPYVFGDFRVTFHPSRHVPLPGGAGAIGQSLSEPLVPPAPATAYVEGGSHTIHVEHPLGSLILQGSAGWVEGALDGVRAEVVLLGIGGLGARPRDYREGYLRALVDAVSARRVIPIHWDDFTLPAGRVEPFGRLVEDVEESLRQVEAHASSRPGLELALLPAWRSVVLFGPEDRAPVGPRALQGTRIPLRRVAGVLPVGEKALVRRWAP